MIRQSGKKKTIRFIDYRIIQELKLLKELPPVLLAMTMVGIVAVTMRSFLKQVRPVAVAGNHAIDGTPVGKSAEVAVVDEHIDLDLAAEVLVGLGRFLGIVAVNGIKLHSPFTAPVDSLVQQFTFTHRPQDETMMVGYKHLQRLSGEGYFLAYLRILMCDDGAVEIYCNSHVFKTKNYFLTLLSSLSP